MAAFEKKYHFDPEQLRAWYHDQGLSVRQIGTLTGTSGKTIQRHLADAGIPRRAPGCNPLPGEIKHVTEKEVAAWKTAIEADPDLGLEALAARFGRSPNTVRNHLGRPPTPVRLPRESARAVNRQRLQELYDQGLRGIEIDRALGWSAGNAAHWQRKLGLDWRPPLPPPDVLNWLYKQTGNLKAVAEQTGLSVYMIRGALGRAGIPLGKRHRPLPLPAAGEDAKNRSERIALLLTRHPEGLTTPQIAEMTCDPAVPHQRALTWCGTTLRRWEKHGYVTRCGTSPGAYKNTPSIVWRLTAVTSA